jgi:6-methylsalicylate decarboxylase
MRIDIHQHIWTEPLLDALSQRRCLPFVRRTREGLTVLHSAQERPYVIDVASESVIERTRLLRTDRVDVAVICLSSPVGIEALSQSEARELIDAHLAGVRALGGRFAAWGPLPIETPEVADVDDMLDRGCPGVSVPASALAGPDALRRMGPVLEHVQARAVPLFVHPGGAMSPGAAEASLNEPLWWRALTDYVSQMHAAWLTFSGCGRREFPYLKVVFAMLAGGAPLLIERLTTRGGPAVDLDDPLTFYDTSSYGPKLVEAMARWVGPSQLVYGSDRPVIEPVPTGREVELMANGSELLAPAAVPA